MWGGNGKRQWWIRGEVEAAYSLSVRRREEEERLPRDCRLAAMQTCPTVVIHLIHMLWKGLLENEGEMIWQWYLSLTLILFTVLASSGDSQRENTTRCLQLVGSEMTIASCWNESGQCVWHLCILVILYIFQLLSLRCHGMLWLFCLMNYPYCILQHWSIGALFIL